MTCCSSIDTVQSYQRIRRFKEDSQETEKLVALGGQKLGGSKRHTRILRGNSLVMVDGSKLPGASSSKRVGAKESSEPRPRARVHVVDLLVGYQDLMRLSASPVTIQKKELYPTIGFIQHPVLPGDNHSGGKSFQTVNI
eukprot:c20835_g1_i1 orf=604-1020(+)